MTILWIAVLVLCLLVGGVIVISELHDARREMAHLPVDIDRSTRRRRARERREQSS